jgi:hypothetical protein
MDEHPRSSVRFQPGYNCWRVEPADRLALFIDNDEAFDALKPLILAAKKSIWILAWVFDPLTRLDPDRVRKEPRPDTRRPHRPDAATTGGSEPGLDVRMLTWDMPFPIAASQLFGPHRGAAFFAGSRVKYRLDNTLPASACHHQKVVIIDGSVALLSGGDIGVDRWDTTRHLDNDPRAACPPVVTIRLGTRSRCWSTAERARRWPSSSSPAGAHPAATRWSFRNGPTRRPGPRTCCPTCAACSRHGPHLGRVEGRPEITECMLLHLSASGGPNG